MTPSTEFPLTDRFTDALNLAHCWHRGQYRKGTRTPYLSHLLSVAALALEFGASEDEAIAALLHDALEDGPASTGRDAADLRGEIEHRFGPQVAALVDAATDDAPPAGRPKRPWEERKREYLDALPHEPAGALLVSAADKLHNARSILTDLLTGGPEVFTRFRQGRDGTLQYYRLLVDTYLAVSRADVRARPRLGALFAELERTVAALEAACGVEAAQVRIWPLLRPGVEVLNAPGAESSPRQG